MIYVLSFTRVACILANAQELSRHEHIQLVDMGAYKCIYIYTYTYIKSV
jgi:hypothetical protein